MVKVPQQFHYIIKQEAQLLTAPLKAEDAGV